MKREVETFLHIKDLYYTEARRTIKEQQSKKKHAHS